MFDQLFLHPETRLRHINSPLLKERLEYLQHCADMGYSPSTLRSCATRLLLIQNILAMSDSAHALDPMLVKATIDKWTSREPRYHSYKSGRGHGNLQQRALHWLSHMHRLQIAPVCPNAYDALVADFATDMRLARGLSEATITRMCWQAEDFLKWYFRDHTSLSDITTIDIDDGIARKGRDDGYSRISIKTYASGIRNFLRHAERKGWCRRGLANLIESPSVYQYESLPACPSWEDVQKVIAGTGANTPMDLRDRAMLLLFAVYGLRSGEVRTLKLDDLDWENNLLRIMRRKGRRQQCYPLVETVGEAILRYLEDGRPRSTPYREIFLTMAAPIQPLQTSSSVWTIVAKRLRPLGLSLRHRGPHVFRHACATHLLAEGLSLKEIGDHLGHRMAKVTAAYAKVDIAGLRKVADLTLGGLA
jgi:site-specific recombinase XerD